MKNIQKMDLLLALYISAIVCAELLGSKIFTLFGVNASVAIFVFPLTYTINDVVVEVYGKTRARSFVKSGFVILLFLFTFTLLATVLPPASRFKDTNDAYNQVFNKSQRIIIASLIAFWLSERFDVYLFSKIRQKLGEKKLWLRNNLSNFIGQFVDTTIFMFLAFYTPGSLGFIISLILPYWSLKCLFSLVETPFTYLGVRWLRKGEEI
ncbi:queuosine precursor transporter [Candidatus Gottesmanbacteria bacterium]|nr:queuosine precursor transporter [Candidatus Gottesmanbacteria bacterium]